MCVILEGRIKVSLWNQMLCDFYNLLPRVKATFMLRKGKQLGNAKWMAESVR